MAVRNSYPEKPIIPFYVKKVEMGAIIAAIQSVPYSVEVKRSAYIVVRNETLNGNDVICGTNLCGVQSDVGRWDAKYDSFIVATCQHKENKTGAMRGFVVFDTLAHCITLLCDKIIQKGIFIGEHVDGKYYKGDVTTPQQEADAYEDEWVEGATVKADPTEVKDFVSMYNQSVKLFV